ncbi:MAG TPA: tRNA preQ1(34) S-adenosylmethionine ribosyltransferase-isomerase QueA [bacterium]|nr:tRNA preQ1(34) S-adenosylmethionine ribosyltransferase-isomerase QueA [bacterium]
MKVSDFDFDLPRGLIAQEPALKRDSSRLLVLSRDSGIIQHKVFSELPTLLHSGDLLVMNNSKVFPARLMGERISTGGKAEIFLSEQKADDTFEVLGRNLIAGEKIKFFDSKLIAKIQAREGKTASIKFNIAGEALWEEIERIGQMPLPPYINSKEKENYHRERYQTVYAKDRGSIAAPTAGLHFTSDLLEKLQKKGVGITEITLHVGLGTFAPVEVEEITEHKMHSESFSISKETIDAIITAKKENRRVIAVGTTTTRVLEHIFRNLELLTSNPEPRDITGSTDIFIYPGYKFEIIDGLITNFHLPKSTLLMLVSAFAGRDNIKAAYKVAIENKYRFFSYGDAMLII